jgi:hypothetical protein
MFTSVMALLLLGYPVAFTLAAGGLVFFFIGVELSVFAPEPDPAVSESHPGQRPTEHSTSCATIRCWRSRSSHSWG